MCSLARSRFREKTHEPLILGTRSNYFGEEKYFEETVVFPTEGSFTCLNEICQDFTNPGPPYKTGGDFFLRRMGREYGVSGSVSLKSPYWHSHRYNGSFSCCNNIDITEVIDVYNGYSFTARSYGATGWNRFRPVKPRVNLGQSIGELKDFPKLYKVALKRFCDLGGAYLNYAFGWKPFVGDLIKTMRLAQKIDRVIKNLRDNNGKWRKRGGTLRDDTHSEVIESEDAVYGWKRLHPTLHLELESDSPVHTTVTRISRDKIWFEAMMKYYIADLEKDRCKSIFSSPLLRYLMGLNVTPSTVWELTPWSWFIDWFGNIGDVLSNMDAIGYDNLVAKYAYVMRRRKTTLEFSESKQVSFPNTTVAATSSAYAECLERARASPWGFDVAVEDASPYQKSIAAALAISYLK